LQSVVPIAEGLVITLGFPYFASGAGIDIDRDRSRSTAVPGEIERCDMKPIELHEHGARGFVKPPRVR